MVEWDPEGEGAGGVSWGKFRSAVVGCGGALEKKMSLGGRGRGRGRSSATAGRTPSPPAGSLRRLLSDRRSEVIDPPPVQEEYPASWDVFSVLASASPLEALAERCNWLGHCPADDVWFGQALMGRGIPESTLTDWLENPLVTVPPLPPPSYGDPFPSREYIFGAVRDMDTASCLKRLLDIYDHKLSSLDYKQGRCRCALS